MENIVQLKPRYQGLEILPQILQNIHKIEEKIQLLTRNSEERKLSISTAHEILIVSQRDIIRLEANGNYCKIFIKDKAPVLVSKTMKYFYKYLDPQVFLKVHQSHTVNLNHIDKIKKIPHLIVRTSEGSSIPISRSRKTKLLNTFLKR